MNVISRRLICILLGSPLVYPAGAWAQSLADAQRDATLSAWASDGSRAQFAPQFAKFFGNAKGRYVDLRADKGLAVEQRAKVSTQFQRVFDGVPSPEVIFPDGFRLLVSAQPHNASQLAMAVTNGRSNQLVAAGLLHNFCGKYNEASRGSTEASATGCENEPTLTIFYSGSTASVPELNREMTAWAKRYVAKGNETILKSVGPRHLKVQVRTLDGQS